MHPRPTLCRLVPVLVALAGAAPAALADWPRFRGPNGTGTVDGPLPVRWTAADVLWKTSLPGIGHSSPVLGGGRLFVQSAAGDGSARWLLCLDAADGKVLWKKEAPGRRAHINPHNSLASSTPAIDGERVYAVIWDGDRVSLSAYDYQGAALWQRDLGGFRSQHGPAFSPVVVDGKVVVCDDQDGSAALLAFDARTGKPAWQAKRKAYRACYSVPFLRDTETGKELIVVTTAAVSGYDPATGAEKWFCTWPAARMPLRTVSSPILANGLVIATAGDGAGDRLCIAVKPGGRGDVTADARVWVDRKAFPYVPSLLAQGEYIYRVNDAGLAACHRAATGETVWQERLGSPVTASPILADGKVYAVGEDGAVFVFEAGPAYKLLGRNEVGEPVSATPAAGGGRLYVRGQNHLFCIGKATAARGAADKGGQH
jgi:outer membrane protein assembly factor BamB